MCPGGGVIPLPRIDEWHRGHEGGRLYSASSRARAGPGGWNQARIGVQNQYGSYWVEGRPVGTSTLKGGGCRT